MRGYDKGFLGLGFCLCGGGFCLSGVSGNLLFAAPWHEVSPSGDVWDACAARGKVGPVMGLRPLLGWQGTVSMNLTPDNCLDIISSINIIFA